MAELLKKTVFVTGASAGIGAACVRRFAAAGWRVAAGARRLDRLEALAAEVGAAHPLVEVLPLACDVDSDASVAEAFRRIGERFGRLDALVNNAGFGHYGTVESLPIDAFRACMETNFFGVLRCTKAALPLLKSAAAEARTRNGAAVVMVSSIVGVRAFPGAGAYCASKFALEGLAETLRVELRDDCISVSAINPGVTQTDFFAVAEGQRPAGFVTAKAGMSSAEVAEVIFRAVRRPRRNAYLTLPGKAGVLLQWISPRLFDYVLGRMWK
ncbi:MAG: SDR family oxidoreductase [Planctomycetes bacterium]|nr:SDR family oxidoreductase [Planctomycetota bacterium]